jgi:type II restriction enzyme
MGKVDDARDILKTLGLPLAQQNEMSALTLLALCGLKEKDSWKKAKSRSLTVTKGIMQFVAEHYGRNYAPNTRETFRRQVLHQFVQAGIAEYNPDDPSLPTNSPHAHYAITDPALTAIRSYGTTTWKRESAKLVSTQGSLAAIYSKRRVGQMVPVRLADGKVLKLSPGKHNEVQAAVIEQFAPRFAPGSIVLYLGDTSQKNLILDKQNLDGLGISLNDHDKLPDVVLFDSKKKWLFLIEAVTSHGPMTPKRVEELSRVFFNADTGLIYVSAFPDFSEFNRHVKKIAWDTEVWIAEFPGHLIHYNGDKFLGPR